ncbi:concanavalin A-like lectin/glucanase domain-containing protein [Pyrenochaeta sp. MPI-SDFR-AT-0127]|nr:concanavalin A-like lectin/glucanase domain-containing protein [Pyrenochaeta sp. MPI-SDFR-AT-0127]
MQHHQFAWVALLFAAQTLAQTTTSCNPTLKTCPADAGLSSTTYTHDFTQGADDANWNMTASGVTYTSSGAEFTITKSGDAPTLQSKWHILFGRVSFHMRSAAGTGIVSSAILQSSDLDEVDWEWLGGNTKQVQTNYFGKGNTTSYDRAVWSPVTDPQTVTRNYTILWTSSATTWYIDGTLIRTLAYADALGGKNYPQTPMNVRIGSWSGGDPANDEGTIEWSGGETNYNDAPFTMYLEKVEVVNDTPASSYTYGDMSGSYESIEVDGKDGATDTKSSSGSSSSATPTSTASQTPSGSVTGAAMAASASAKIVQAQASGGQGRGVPGWTKAVLGSWIVCNLSWMI